MSLQITWALRGKTLSVRVRIPRGNSFLFKVAHPFVGFLGNISSGSLKALHFIQPIRIVEENSKNGDLADITNQITNFEDVETSSFDREEDLIDDDEFNDELETIFNDEEKYVYEYQGEDNDVSVNEEDEIYESIRLKEEEEEDEVLIDEINNPSELLVSVQKGLLYYSPERCEEGVNGTYFLRDVSGEIVAIFKPRDEEGNSENNPKRNQDTEDLSSRGLIEGEGALREFAAYKLDRGNFSDVPETELVTLSHEIFKNENGDMEKTGSLQKFIINDGASWDMGPNRFPVKEIHKIGILDLRIFNTDRHGGNILFRENLENGQLELIPIDHGLSLPATLNRAWFDWLMWSQANVPFDESSLQYIREIDVEEDAKLLRQIGIREECIRTMKISTTLLKKGAEAGLTLFQIGSIVSRTDPDVPCELENMFNKAKEECSENDEEFMQVMYRIMDEEIAKAKSM